MKRSRSATQPASKRGRPQKFGRPSQLVAVTLPDDVIAALQSLDADLGWAIVRLTEAAGHGSASSVPAEARPPIELARLPRGRGLILVRAASLREIPDISLIPLSDGRAFLALSGDSGIAELELKLLDRLEALPRDSSEAKELSAMRAQLRVWRQAPHLRFRSMSIIVAEGVSDPRAARLSKLDSAG